MEEQSPLESIAEVQESEVEMEVKSEQSEKNMAVDRDKVPSFNEKEMASY